MEPVPVQELPLEVQFLCAQFDSMVDRVPAEECRQFLKDFYREHKRMEASYKNLIGHRWFCDNKREDSAPSNGTS